GVDEGDEAEVDPLVAACRVIGARLDVTIQAPPASSRASIDDAVSAIGRASGVQVRRVLLKDGWQRQDNGPLLAFLSDDRPIALLPVGAAGYEIVIPGDPAPAQRVTPALAAGLQAHGYTFCRSLPVKKLTLADVFTFAMAGTQRDWATILALGLTGGLIGLAAPLAMGLIFSRIVPSGEYDQLLLVMFALFSAAVANSLFQFTQAIAAMRLETRMDSAVEMGVWDRLLNLPTVFHRQYEAGDLAMRAMGIGRIRQVISEAALSSVLTSVFSFISFGLLFYYSPFLALIATALFLVIVLATIPAVLAQLNYERKGQEVQGRVAGLMLQLVSGVSRIRGTGSEERALAAWARSFAQQSRLGFRAQSVANNLATFHAAIPTVSTLLVFAAVAVAPNAIASLPAFLAFNAAFAQVIGAAVSISGTFTSLLEVVPLYERAKPILETLPEFDPGKRWPGDLTGEIELSHVSFRYSEDGPLVLDDVSLHIRPGQFVAFVGASGAGKSTIFRLLLGFERPATGSVHYDRHDLAGLDLQATRRQIGVVLQNGRLVPGDIFTNIVGSAPLTLDDAWEAAKQSGLDADIRAMPMGMHTVLSEGESTLSGGQRQRLLIARAIVARPKILLFDEATSALDNVTQAKVSRSLESLKATRVVVAHRLSTVANADRIYVIERGKVVQQGRYQELMSVPGPFADLAKRQMV
ncbi:MAG TPA: NHLP bacteriocin export ABC transporter permease/ATPase subunit, partial [Pirellulales bacterium]